MSQDEIELVAPAEPFRAHPGREPAECSVCLEEISTGQCVRTLQCSHCFHVQCIDPWFCTNAICPSCRKDVVPPPPPEPQAAAITLED
ncbi:hypothetical protein GQ54DRAFT_263744 [Martensiomyces pterosporus]|nr:hypothetical protein GQ54DRAFT_263744 [Martensiomyces pterosporus]